MAAPDGPTASEANLASGLDPEAVVFFADCSSMLPLVAEAKDPLASAVVLMSLAQQLAVETAKANRPYSWTPKNLMHHDEAGW